MKYFVIFLLAFTSVFGASNSQPLSVHKTGGQILAPVSEATFGTANHLARINTANTFAIGQIIITFDANDVGLIVKGKPSQAGDLQQWQNSAGTALAYVDFAGIGNFAALNFTGNMIGGGNLTLTGIPTFGSSSTVLTDSTGKVLSAALNTVGVPQGGTGQTSYTNGQLLIGNTTGNTLAKATLTGTANQVIVTNGAGSITLSLPQDLGTASSPTFAGLTTGTMNVTTLSAATFNAKANVLDANRIVTLSSSGTDSYVGTAGTTIISYVVGAHYIMQANTANTGTASLNIDGQGAKTIVKVVGGVTTTLADNDIRINQICDFAYDGTNLQLQSTLGNAPSSGAPTTATYITQTADATLSAEQALGALATGILKNTTTTGVLSIATAGTDYVTPSSAVAQTFSVAGAASTPAVYFTGAILTGGTGTTNFPHILVQPTGATARTTWSTSGTVWGANMASGFAGDFISVGVNGAAPVFSVGSTGNIVGNNITCNNSLGMTGPIAFGSQGFTASTLEFSRANTNQLKILSGNGDSTFNDASTANSGTNANRYIFGIDAPTFTSTGTSVTDTIGSTFRIGGPPVAGTNTTISGTPWSMNIESGPSNFGGPVALKGYTVATLPSTTATGRVTGAMAYVTDATTPTYNGTLTGGGAVVVPVFYNGSAWVSH